MIFFILLLLSFAATISNAFPDPIALGQASTCAVVNKAVKCIGLAETFGFPLISTSPPPNDLVVPATIWPLLSAGPVLKATSVSIGSRAACFIVPESTIGAVGCCGRTSDRTTLTGASVVAMDSAGTTPLRCSPGLSAPTFIKFSADTSINYPRKLAMGTLSACALYMSGSLRCWGDNTYGQLGIGAPAHKGFLADIVVLPTVGFVPTAGAVIDVRAGAYHYCALFATGSLRCWGRSRGYGGSVGTTNYGLAATDMSSLAPIAFNPAWGPVVNFDSGLEHNCAVFLTGTSYCFGKASTGATGSASDLGIAATPAAMPDPALVWNTTDAAVGVAVGDQHSCFLFADVGVRCFGGSGQALGYGDPPSYSTPLTAISVLPFISFSGASGVSHISAGDHHTCAMLITETSSSTTPQVRCWGAGFNQRLGGGSDAAIGADAPYQAQLGLSTVKAGFSNEDDWPTFELFPSAADPLVGLTQVRFLGPMNTEQHRANFAIYRDQTGARWTGAVIPPGLPSLTYAPFPPRIPATTRGGGDLLFTVDTSLSASENQDGVRVSGGTVMYDPFSATVTVNLATVEVSATTYFEINMTSVSALSGRTFPKCVLYSTMAWSAALGALQPTGGVLVPAVPARFVPGSDTVACDPITLPAAAPGSVARLFVDLGLGNTDYSMPNGFLPRHVGNVTFYSVSVSGGSLLAPLNPSPNFGDFDGGTTSAFEVLITGITASMGDVAKVRLTHAPTGQMAIVNALSVTYSAALGSKVSFVSPPDFLPLLTNPLVQKPVDLGVAVAINGQTFVTTASPSPLVFSMLRDPVLNSITPRATLTSVVTVTLTLRGSGFLTQFGAVVRFTHAYRNDTSSVVLSAPLAATTTTAIFTMSTASTPPFALVGKYLVQFAQNGVDFAPSQLYYYVLYVVKLYPDAGPTTGGTDIIVRGGGFKAESDMQCRFTVLATTYFYTPATFVAEDTYACTSPNITTIFPGSQPSEVSLGWSTAPASFTPLTGNTAMSFNFINPDVVSVQPPSVPSGIPLFFANDGQHPTHFGGVITIFGASFYNSSAGHVWCRFTESTGNIEILSAVSVDTTGGLSVVCPVRDKAGLYELAVAFNGQNFHARTTPGPLYFGRFQVFHLYPPTLPNSVVGPSGTIEVVGENFVAPNAPVDLRCQFQGVVATTPIDTPGTFVSSSSVLCTLPPAPLTNFPNGLAIKVSVSFDALSTVSNDDRTFAYFPAPIITAVDPLFSPAAGGQPITVYGFYFYPAVAAWFKPVCSIGGAVVEGLQPTFANGTNSTSAMVCVTKPGTTPVPVSVSFNGVHFAPPHPVLLTFVRVFSVVPALGPAAGGFTVSLSGFGFVNGPGSLCRVGDPFTTVPPVPAVYINSQQIKCVMPPAPGLFATLTVVEYSADGGKVYTSDESSLSYFDTPEITFLQPPGSPAAGLGTVVTIIGNNFFSSGVSPLCTYGGAGLPWSVFTPTSIVATTPAATSEGAAIECSFNGGYDFTADGWIFSVIALKSITINSGPMLGGAVVEITGTGFQDTGVASCLFYNGTDPFTGIFAPATIVSQRVLTCLSPPMPAGAPAFGDKVMIDISMDQSAFTGTPVTYQYYANPNITAIYPSTGPATGGSCLVLYGANGSLPLSTVTQGVKCIFGGGAAIVPGTVNGTCDNGTAISRPNPNSLGGYVTCITPPGVGSYSVALSLNGGSNTLSLSPIPDFIYVNVLQLNPDTSPAFGGFPVYISGSGLLATGMNFCRFGTLVVPATIISSLQLLCLTPVITGTLPLSVPVEVTDNGITYTADNRMFTFYSEPIITALFPASGPIAGGTIITVMGTDFMSPRGLTSTMCSVGPVSGSAVSVISATLVTCRSPPTSELRTTAQSFPVEISLNGGFVFTAQKVPFFYYEAYSVAPLLGPLHYSTLVTISGAGFTAQSWDGIGRCVFGTYPPVPTTFLNSRSVTCMTPAAGGNSSSIFDAPVSLPVSVIAGGGSIRSPLLQTPSFYYYLVQNVTFSPAFGVSGGNTTLVISSTSFSRPFIDSPLLRCRVGGTPSRAQLVSGTLFILTCVTPPGQGTSDVEFSNNAYNFFWVGRFGYYTAISVTPARGPDTGQTLVQITGSGFGATGINLRCKFAKNTIPTSSLATFVSATLVTCNTPLLGRSVRAMTALEVTVGGPADTTVPDAAARFHAAQASGESDDLWEEEWNDERSAPIRRWLLPRGGEGEREDDADAAGEKGSGSGRFAGLQAVTTLGVASVTVNAVEFTSRAPNGLTDFIFYRTPEVTAIDPPSGFPAGGQIVTIYGSGLGPQTLCRWGPPTQPPVPAQFISPTELRCAVTAGKAGATPLFMSLNAQQYLRRNRWPIYVVNECPAGYFSFSELSACIPCPAGEYTSLKGSRKCLKCDPTAWTSETNSTSCNPCPDNTIIDGLKRSSSSLCQCLPGYYNKDGVTGAPCEPCPVGAKCAGKVEVPIAQPGFWQSDNSTFLFQKCDSPKACPGGSVAACGLGYRGRLCADCQPYFFRSGRNCRKCPSLAWATVFALPGFFTIVAAYFYATSGTFMTPYGGITNIIIFYFQTLFILSKLKLGWPSRIHDALTALGSFFSLNIDILALECVRPEVDFRVRWSAMTVSPLLFLLAFIAVTVAATSIRACRGRKTAGLATGRNPGPKDFAFNGFLRLLTQFYLALIVSVFALFDCTKQLDGSITLDAQPNLLCYDTWWDQLMPLGAGMMFVYMALLPMLIIWVLRRRRKAQKMPYTVARIGGLYVYYKSYTWEVAWLLEKFAMGVSLTFFSSNIDTQIIALLLVNITGLYFHALMKPFYLPRHNTLATFLRWVGVVVIVMGSIFHSNQFPDPTLKPVLEGICSLLLLVSLFVIAGAVGKDWITRRRAARRLRPDTEWKMSAIVHPKGKADLYEWLANTTSNLVVVDFPDVIDRLYEFYTTQQIKTPHREAGRMADYVADEFTSRIFYDKAIPYIRTWMIDLTDPAQGKSADKEEQIKAFVGVVGDFKRFMFGKK